MGAWYLRSKIFLTISSILATGYQHETCAALCCRVPPLKRKPARKVRRKGRRVSVVLTGDEYNRLRGMGTITERSMSWLARYAVRRLLEEYERRQLPLPLEMTETE